LGIPVSAGGWALYKSILVWVKASMLSLVGRDGLSPENQYHLLAILQAPCRSLFSKQDSISALTAATLSFLSCLMLLLICLVSALVCCLLWCLSLRSLHLLAINLLVSCETWLHFPLWNSSFPCFPFLLDPVSCVPAPAGKRGSMIQSIFLVFLLLRKHDSDLNNVEYFWEKNHQHC